VSPRDHLLYRSSDLPKSISNEPTSGYELIALSLRKTTNQQIYISSFLLVIQTRPKEIDLYSLTIYFLGDTKYYLYFFLT
jgi:hypothetical protein